MGQLNWLDIGAIAVIGVFALDGLAKGLVLSLFNTVKFTGAFFAAIYVSGPLAKNISINTPIDDFLSKWLTGKALSLNSYAAVTLNVFQGDGGGGSLSYMLLLTITFVTVFVCAMVLITMLANGANIAARLPVVKQFNSLGGLLFGTLKGTLLLYIIFVILAFVIPLMKPSNIFVSALSKSKFAVNFYTYNFIIPWIIDII